MNIKISTFLLLFANTSYILSSNKVFHQHNARSSIEVLRKNAGSTDSEKFIRAIIDRDVEQVVHYAKIVDLHEPCIEVILDSKQLEAAKCNLGVQPVEIQAIHIGHNYLSIAILNTLSDETDAQRRDSILVLKELLTHKANAQYPAFSKHRAYGVGHAVIISEDRNGEKVGIPYEFFCPLIFYPVIYQCRPEVLELLFQYGAQADACLDGFNGHATLLQHARANKATELISIIEKEMASYDAFRKSEQFDNLALSMQQLYLSLNMSDRALFIQTTQRLTPSFKMIMQSLCEIPDMPIPNVNLYLDVCDPKEFQNKKNIDDADYARMHNHLKNKFLEVSQHNLLEIKKSLTADSTVKNTLLQYCKSQDKQLFLVASFVQPCKQYSCLNEPIIAALKIDLA